MRLEIDCVLHGSWTLFANGRRWNMDGNVGCCHRGQYEWHDPTVSLHVKTFRAYLCVCCDSSLPEGPMTFISSLHRMFRSRVNTKPLAQKARRIPISSTWVINLISLHLSKLTRLSTSSLFWMFVFILRILFPFIQLLLGGISRCCPSEKIWDF